MVKFWERWKREWAEDILAADLSVLRGDILFLKAVTLRQDEQLLTKTREIQALTETLDAAQKKNTQLSAENDSLSVKLSTAKEQLADFTHRNHLLADDLHDAAYEMDAQYREIELLLGVLKLKVHAAVAEETKIKERRPKRIR